MKIAVITVSDRASRGEYEDLSGPKIREILSGSSIECEVSLTIVADEEEQIRKALQDNLDKDYILTTGGTGISPRDITPDVSREVCEKELPGIAEMLRAESYKETKNAVFSRGFAGMEGRTIIVNFPGSVKAVILCTKLLLPILEHGVKMLRGAGH
ncbi:MAG: MogA/MoaB family molybdenum cofactor biosynthesis protein [Candidatus Aminicenantes bacterium]|nr:MogA/MoaB family molybdenum cofactor biosynthesis protein [Candidatus Aminicenantes bacterium]